MQKSEPSEEMNVLAGSNGNQPLWRTHMVRLLSSIAIPAVLIINSAFAQPVPPQIDCTDANITKASAEMDKLPGGEKKERAMNELAMAKEMMAKKDMDACKTHLTNALKTEVSK
jgi:hypothetical protein